MFVPDLPVMLSLGPIAPGPPQLRRDTVREPRPTPISLENWNILKVYGFPETVPLDDDDLVVDGFSQLETVNKEHRAGEADDPKRRVWTLTLPVAVLLHVEIIRNFYQNIRRGSRRRGLL